MIPRPPTVTIASILLALLSLTNLVQGEPGIFEGNLTAADLLPLVVGVGGLVGARGLWMLKRWAMWLAIIVCVLDILINALALTSPFTAIAAIYIVVGALVILLVVLPNSRRAYT
jgi:uncharacterized membrane protein (DUF2068 family)